MKKSILDALFSRTRQAVLSACLLRPEKWWYLSDLAAHLKVRPSSLQRELAALLSGGLLETRKDGNRVYYRANSECPVLQELQSLFVKTAGIADVVRALVKSNTKKIDLAFIYGSIARAEEMSTSDIDVFLVGNVKLVELTSALSRAEEKLGREVNPTILTTKEFRQKLKAGDGFVMNVLRDSKIFLKGSEREIEEVARQGRASED